MVGAIFNWQKMQQFLIFMNLSSKRIFQHWISAKNFQRKLKWSNQTQGRIVMILTNRGNSNSESFEVKAYIW